MSKSVEEVALAKDKARQTRGETVRVDEVADEASAEDRGNAEARDEAIVCSNRGVLDSSGSGPTVGIIFDYYPAMTVASALKRLNAEIRITLALHSLDNLTEDEIRILRTTEILLVQPPIMGHSPLIRHLPNLKWMHSLSAGVDKLMYANNSKRPPPPYILTRNVGPFSRQMAEFVITMIIARERHFREFWEQQTKKIWTRIVEARPLSELSIGIIGFGSIGQEVARVAKFFDLRVWALVRSLPTELNKCPHVDEYRLVPDIGDVLSSCDYVVSVLPSTPSTNGFFDGDTLSKGKTKKPVFINIGRGNVISNSTILHALNEGWISHAIVDVFEVEPLPLDSPLWSHTQVTITPHNSIVGITREMLLMSFLENYDRYLNGDALFDTVDWEKGY